MGKIYCMLLAVCLIFGVVNAASILLEEQLKNYMFTQEVSANLKPLLPTKLGYSKLWPFPIQTYEIAAMRAKHQFLPTGFPPTQIFAYAGKVGNKFQPSFPGPSLISFKNMPIYVIWTNNIQGRHLLPVDVNPPFQMIAEVLNEVPTVPHAHGLQTEMGSDGQPVGYWTFSGKKGKDFFSLTSKSLQKNQAIFRYHNTKQGLLWFHDHTMGITRLNVYAGLVGFYQIIDPSISFEERNILRFYGDLQRKYFSIVDKTFNTDGSLFYPNSTQSQGYTAWVPEFFGNTIVVNGKVWPKVTLRPQQYRFAFLNGCQSRFLKLSFQNKGRLIQFKVFRRDSDYLKKVVTVREYLILVGARVQIFIDFSNIQGQILVKNSAATPFPMGNPPTQYTSKVMKLIVKNSPRNLQKGNSQNNPFKQLTSQQKQCTLTSLVSDRIGLYMKNQYNQTAQREQDYLDEKQAQNYMSLNNNKQISIDDFQGSTEPTSNQIKNWIQSQKSGSDAVNIVETNMQSQQKFLQTFMRSLKVNPAYNSGYFSKQKQKDLNNSLTNAPYPRFSPGIPYFTILNQILGTNGAPKTIKIDDVGLKVGCKGATFKQGETYDFYIINLTMDDHPIHIHLVNFQVIGRFKFDMLSYTKAWKLKNGQFLGNSRQNMPQQVSVLPFKNSPMQPPQDDEKQFLDVILTPSNYVTVARVKFSNHYGKSFPFDIRGTRYVWHCHILEHEDNQMMRYFCVQ